jgi:hypothetical protein
MSIFHQTLGKIMRNKKGKMKSSGNKKFKKHKLDLLINFSVVHKRKLENQ